MIVPQFWAEAQVQHLSAGRQVTIRRFGWSDSSVADAQQMADQRATEALERWKAGEKDLPRRDWKRPYNGAVGVPIREEIVSRHGETIITRNSYGALCLNTPRVYFADIDLATRTSEWQAVLCGFALFIVALLLVSRFSIICLAVSIGVMAICWWLPALIERIACWWAGPPFARARRRVERFVQRHPEWHIRLYRTPAGLRLMAVHDLFEADSSIVQQSFRKMSVDPLFALMCRNQRCFRARVSPKPWRVGLSQHIKPNPGVWPIAEDRLPARREWIAGYEWASRGHSACQFVESLGSSTVHPIAREVYELHDELSGALLDRPMA